ncbi:OB-fold nucleic acid binding domain-containing protein [Thermoproteota archaeon]
MNIKELEPRQGDVDIQVEVVSVEQPREFQKFGKPGRVANAVIKDATGEMKLTLWNEQIDQVKSGDKIHIQKGYVNEWQGEKQLTTGKFGTLDVVESGSAEPAPEEKPAESAAPEPAPAEEKKEEQPPQEENSTPDEALEENIEEEEVK